MKVTRQPDGTMQIEGSAEEVRALLQPPVNAVGMMVVQRPVAACAPAFGGQVWVGTIPGGAWAGNAAAANPLPAWWNSWRG